MLTQVFHISGLARRLQSVSESLAKLERVYRELDGRLAAYAANSANTVLCAAGCSHCCRSGGFFAVTLVEALRLSRAVAALPSNRIESARAAARNLIEMQRRVFAEVPGEPDQPGGRDEALFSARISAVARRRPCCPLLHEELCSVYAGRPLLCRAYGYAVDAYAVEAAGAMVFRSLCVLYEGVQLTDYVRAKELRAELADISLELAGGHEVGRFTLPEAILAYEESVMR